MTIQVCATVGKTFLDDATAIVNMSYEMKVNSAEKYGTMMCSPAAKIV
jgi:hypothetical protein